MTAKLIISLFFLKEKNHKNEATKDFRHPQKTRLDKQTLCTSFKIPKLFLQLCTTTTVQLPLQKIFLHFQKKGCSTLTSRSEMLLLFMFLFFLKFSYFTSTHLYVCFGKLVENKLFVSSENMPFLFLFSPWDGINDANKTFRDAAAADIKLEKRHQKLDFF